MNQHSGTPALLNYFPRIFYAACQSCGRTFLGLLTAWPAALLPAFAAFLLLTSGNASAQDSVESDRAVLVALYNATDGPNWRDNTHWLSNEPLSEWRGVGVNDDGRVATLGLGGNQLTGPIPAQLSQLSQLQYLSLYSNQLTGEIPVELSQLSQLQYLSLSTNQLTGEIPVELSQLSQLQYLSLSRNQLTGPIPAQLGQLNQLGVLYLSRNQLTGEIPVELSQLSQLQDLSLYSNQLTGEIPVELSQLSQLQYLSLHSNQLTGPIPAQLGQLTQLTRLYLFRNQLTGEIPAQLGQLNQLERLYLGVNQLTGTIPAQLGQLNQLGVLYLGHNQLTGTIPAQLGQLNQLEELDLGVNQLTGPIPVQLGQLNQLEELDLGGNQLTGPIPVQLGQLNQLEELDLGGNQLTGTIPTWLGQLNQLKRLDLGGNQLTGTIPTWLGQLNQLEKLGLGGNQLTGTIPTWLGQLNQLGVLYLGRNQLTGEIPAQLGQLNQLKRLDLGGNQLTGEIPAQLGQLNQLEELDLGGNQLTGEIPAELGQLTQLTRLRLDHNQLTGPIPPELENLTQLQVFDIRNTGLCVPADSELYTWIATIQDFQGTATCGASNLVANFVNGNTDAFNSRVYLWNPSGSSGDVTVRVFTLPLTGGLAQELTTAPLNLGTLGAKSALNVKVAEDILAPLGITLPYTNNEGDLTLEFTIQAVDVRGATQVFSSSLAFGTHPLQEIPFTSSGSPTVLVANFMNGNSDAFNSRAHLFNPSDSDGNVTVRVFTLPLSDGTAQELTGTPLDLGPLEARSALNIKLAEDILIPLGITLPYTTDGGNLTLEFTIQAADVRGAAQVFSSSFAFGVYPLQEIPSTSSGSPTVLVANFMNGNSDAFSSRAYLFNPSDSDGNVTVRVFTLPLSDGTAQELTGPPLDLGILEARSALNIKLAEDILTPLGITLPYTTDGGNLTLEFTIQAADVRGTAQVFSSSFAFGTYPMQEIPSTSSGSPTVLVANFMNGNDAALNSRVYLWNPSLSAGSVTVRVFTLPLTAGVAQELTTAPLDLGTLGAESARNLKLVEDILTPLGIPTPYVTDGGNLTLEFTIQAADVRGAAQVFSSSFAFGTVPLQVIQ